MVKYAETFFCKTCCIPELLLSSYIFMKKILGLIIINQYRKIFLAITEHYYNIINEWAFWNVWMISILLCILSRHQEYNHRVYLIVWAITKQQFIALFWRNSKLIGFCRLLWILNQCATYKIKYIVYTQLNFRSIILNIILHFCIFY